MRPNSRSGRDDTLGPVADAVAVAEPWVSVEQVAAHLGVKKISVYRWIETRGLPARKIGKLWKVKLTDVDAWVRARGAAALETTTPRPVPHGKSDERKRVAPSKSVLVIDDDELVRDSIGDFLTDRGYAVAFASNGATALEGLSEGPHPDVIILDLKMPRLDGWKFRERQLSDPRLAAIRVIVVTATADERLQGVSAVLRKPLRLPQLAQAMDSLFEVPLRRGDST